MLGQEAAEPRHVRRLETQQHAIDHPHRPRGRSRHGHGRFSERKGDKLTRGVHPLERALRATLRFHRIERCLGQIKRQGTSAAHRRRQGSPRSRPQQSPRVDGHDEACWHLWRVRGILPPVRSVLSLMFLVLASGALPADARARSVAVTVGRSTQPAETRALVIEAIAERGVRLVRTPDGEICDGDPVPCAAELAARTGADATLVIDVIPPPPEGAETTETTETGTAQRGRVRARLVPGEGEPAEAEAEIGAAGVSAAIAEVVGSVLEAAPPAMGFLMVRSEPSGATVEVDGAPLGAAPMRASLTPGEHQVRVTGPAGVFERSVTVSAGQETSLSATLGESLDVPTEPSTAGPQPTRSESSPFNWMIAGGLAVGGVITLISPLSTLAREGQCEEAIEDVGCVEMVRAGPQTGVLLGIGLAALIAAIVVDVTAPIRVDVVVGTTEARAVVRGVF